MSGTKHTRDSIHPGCYRPISIPDEISCVFRFGKDAHCDPYIDADLIDIIEKAENSKMQAADDMTLSEAAYQHAAIMSIKNQLKLSSSLQVHSSDGSLISVFNTEPNNSESSTYTNLEPSLDLSIGDPSYIQQLLDNTDLQNPISDLEFTPELFDNFSIDSEPFDPLQFDPNMTIQDLTDVPMEPTHIASSSELASTQLFDSINDETTVSSVSSFPSEDNDSRETTQGARKKSKSAKDKLARFGNKQVIKYSDEYHSRRVKNNEAVKKSRMKAKEKQKTSEVQMDQLTQENRMLNDRVDLLVKELQVLRSLYKELRPDGLVKSNKTLAHTNAP